MTILTISNGPSGRDADVTGADCVIAVNKAATIHAATWWVLSDASCWIEHHEAVIGRPRMFSRSVVRDHIRGLYGRADLIDRYDQWPAMMQDHYPHPSAVEPTPGTSWNQWSGLAALGLTYMIARMRIAAGAGVDVVLAGYDLAGAGDCLGDGTLEQQHGRGQPDRWPREYAVTMRWVNAIRSLGATLTYAAISRNHPNR